MRTITIKVHWVARSPADISLRSEDLQILFRTAGIELDLMPGEDIPDDPIFFAPPSYEDLVRRYAAKDRAAGHLIVGLEPPVLGSHVAGQLLDPLERGVCVVYRRCNYILQHGERGLLQTCAHEVGHMLNLAHEDVVAAFASTMNQAEKRVGDMGQCWTAAAREAADIRQAGLPDFFLPPPRPLEAYPIAHVARHTLNSLSNDRLMPWGGIFERPYDGTNDWSQE